MNAYSLPYSLYIGGRDYTIRTDFRVVLDVLEAMTDPNLSLYEKQYVMLYILLEDFDDLPDKDWEEAVNVASEFIDAGIPDGKPKPKTMDWQQDAGLIIPAVNKVAGMEIRAQKDLHWWTFLGYFMEIEDGTFSQVLAIRQKKASGKKLEKYEKEFERNNPELIKLKKKESDEVKAEKSDIEKWL